jgi:hypothetical protein
VERAREDRERGDAGHDEEPRAHGAEV